MDDGTVWYTTNWGTTWTQRVLPTAAVNLSDITFFDELNGAISGYVLISASNYATVWRTIDGGYSWEVYTYGTAFDSAITHFGLNALIMCSENEIHAVGEDIDALSIIWTLKPAGWS
jgi:photosystem II stability/assembly factor-like uncharacterized protein